VPEEVALRVEIDKLNESLRNCADEKRRDDLRKEIESKALKLGLLSDSNRRRRSGKRG
jgi:hypothetical protein